MILGFNFFRHGVEYLDSQRRLEGKREEKLFSRILEVVV